jgi:DNA primase
VTSLVPSEDTKKLLERSTQKYQDRLTKEPGVLAYLVEERGLSQEAIAHFRLGYTGEDPDVGDPPHRISFPYVTPGGVVQIRFRAREPEPQSHKYLGTEGMGTRPYNTDALRLPVQTVYLCEGEMDTISCWVAGLPAVGIPGAKAWKKNYWRLFRYRRVILLGDGDDPGRQFAHDISRELEDKYIDTAIVDMEPGVDINKLLVKGGPEAVRELVRV